MNTYSEWILKVDVLLRVLGHKHKGLDEKSWRQLYDEGLTPFKAVVESEFDGNITWHQFRKLTNYKPLTFFSK